MCYTHTVTDTDHQTPSPHLPQMQPLLDPPVGLEGPYLWFYVGDSAVLVNERGEVPVADDASELPIEGRDPQFLGLLGGVGCWSVDAGSEHDIGPDGVGVVGGPTPPANHRFEHLYGLYGLLGEDGWAMAGRAVQLVEWARTTRFCGRCAKPLSRIDGERAVRCATCPGMFYPRLAPAVIMAVTKGDQILLGRNVNFPMPMYSTLAGFVEPGESLEAAVRREVMEEVGLEIDEPKYFGSQPWPFPHQVMLGYTAEWVSGDIVIDPTELADAGWFSIDAMPELPPGNMSISRWLIDDFVARVARG